MIEKIIDSADLYLLQDGLKELSSDPQNLCLVNPVKNVHLEDFYILVFQLYS